jgi:hypothetical protein
LISGSSYFTPQLPQEVAAQPTQEGIVPATDRPPIRALNVEITLFVFVLLQYSQEIF